VGGLLYAGYVPSNTVLLPCFDGNGNVYAMVDNSASGSVRASFEYSAFGETLRASGDMASAVLFRFSTKTTDLEDGFLYYGFRYYNPMLGRFMGRDPIREKGGLHLYAFVANNGVNHWDVLGHIEAHSDLYTDEYGPGGDGFGGDGSDGGDFGGDQAGGNSFGAGSGDASGGGQASNNVDGSGAASGNAGDSNTAAPSASNPSTSSPPANTSSPSSSVPSSNSDHGTIIANSDGTYTNINKDGSRVTFVDNGDGTIGLISITKPNQGAVSAPIYGGPGMTLDGTTQLPAFNVNSSDEPLASSLSGLSISTVVDLFNGITGIGSSILTGTGAQISARQAALGGAKYPYRFISASQLRTMSRLGAIEAQRLATIGRVMTLSGTAIGAVLAGVDVYSGGASNRSLVRGAVDVVGTATAFIPVAGPFISLGISIVNASGGFDWLYNNFDNTPRLWKTPTPPQNKK